MTIHKRYFVTFALLGVLMSIALAAHAMPIVQEPAALDAQVGTAFTYQGTLSDNGSPANGTYDFQFILYNAVSGGSQVGSTVTVDDVTVSDGLFTVALNFGNIFDGTAVWLDIGVRPGASGGAYTLLTPRQRLRAAPYALGLRPSAVIRQTSVNPALSVESEGDGIQVDDAANDGLQVGQSGQNGIRVVRAEGAGLRVISAGNGGVYIDDSDQDAIHIDNAGLDGIDINNSGTDGVQVDNAGRHGLRVSNAISTGLFIDNTGEDGIFICSTGDETNCTPSGANNGVEIGKAEHRGVSVGSAGSYGVYVNSAGSDGLHVGSAGSDGVWATGDFHAGHFYGNVTIQNGTCECTLATVALNSSDQPLQPGDVVTVQGIQASGVDGVPVLIGVAQAGAGEQIIGVVDGRAELIDDDDSVSEGHGQQIIPREGPAQPGNYVTIITHGLALVNVGGALSASTVTAGARLSVSDEGAVAGLQALTVGEPMPPTVGLALSSPDENGQVWVLVNPQ